MERNKIYHGNNLDILRTFPDNSIDSIVTDPPYGLGKEPNALEVLQSWITTGYHEIKGKGFMGKEWDSFVPQPVFWKECLRVLKPGGHLLSFAGTRTYDWVVMGLRIAGFEIRDQIAWVYGSGFPKSMNIEKAIEGQLVNGTSNKKDFSKLSGERLDRGDWGITKMTKEQGFRDKDYTHETKQTDRLGKLEATTPEAKQWQGWGTALKPALEPIVMARKPLDGTVAQNVLKHGVGGINIDGCRVELSRDDDTKRVISGHKTLYIGGELEKNYGIENQSNRDLGRFPANFIHDGSEEVVKLFPNSDGAGGSTPQSKITGYGKNISNGSYEYYGGDRNTFDSGSGSASRFFYTAKASQNERNFGLSQFEDDVTTDGRTKPIDNAFNRGETKRKNIHPTVKPIDLMRYLVRLVTPKNGICLDPYMGSGTTAIACKSEKINYVGCELDEEYIKIAEARIKAEVVVYDIFDFMD